MRTESRQHRFEAGNQVRFLGKPVGRLRATGPYEVVSQLPIDAGGIRYRVKSSLETHARVADEEDLEHAYAHGPSP